MTYGWILPAEHSVSRLREKLVGEEAQKKIDARHAKAAKKALPKKPASIYSDEEVATACELAERMPITHVAIKMGIPTVTISNWVNGVTRAKAKRRTHR